MRVAVVKSERFKLKTSESPSEKGVGTVRSTNAPLEIRPALGLLMVMLDPSLPVAAMPPTTRLPCAIA